MESGDVADIQIGKSLLVPSVLDLTKQPISAVPARYVRSDRDDSAVSEDPRSEVPIIDMQRLIVGDSEELAKLHSACRDWGFFQVVNHGVSTLLVDKMKREVEEFFNLPMEEKKRFWQTKEEIEGFGQAFVVSEEQKLDWGDMFFLTTLPISMRKPHLFPNLPLPFRDTLECYSKEIKVLGVAIIDQMSKALKVEEKELREALEDGIQSMRMNYYPPCPEPDKVIGLHPHSDGTTLTILLQVNDVQGLEIKHDGKWVPVMPLSNAFVVNIGDILEIITNGAYKSIEHRATVNSAKKRMSIATFFNPSFEGKVAPASSLVSQQTPPLFKSMTHQEYAIGLFARVLDGKSYLDTLRIDHTKN